MQQSYKAHLSSESPFIMNNGRLANPRDPFAKQLKQLTQKRAKTDADLTEIGKIEWHGSLYLSDGHPCLPGLMLDACLINAAGKIKKKAQAKAGLFSGQDFPLLYDGPQTIPELWEDDRFVFVANCRPQGKGTVIRTRPIFPAWEADVEIVFNDAQLNASDITELLTIAGRDIGIGNWRPRFGRFRVSVATRSAP